MKKPNRSSKKPVRFKIHLTIGSAFQTKFDKCVDRVRSAIIPLFQADGGKPVPCGSAVLFSAYDRAFILTADHVLEADSLWCFNSDLILTPFVGTFKRCPPFDIAVAELDQNQLKALSHNRFLELQNVRPQPSAARYYGAIVGFPASKAGVIWQTTRIKTEQYAMSNLVLGETKTEIAIKFDKRRVETTGERVQHTAPNPIGMSGGGIFTARITVALPDRVYLAGVGTLWKKSDRTMLGTPIEIVLSFLRSAFRLP
jgi:hypothetical protein